MKITEKEYVAMTEWQRWMKEKEHNWQKLLTPGLYYLYRMIMPVPYEEDGLVMTNIGFPYYILCSGRKECLTSFYHIEYEGQDCTLIDILYRTNGKGKRTNVAIRDGNTIQRIQLLTDYELPLAELPEDFSVGVWYKKHLRTYEAMAKWYDKTRGGIRQESFRNFIIRHWYDGQEGLLHHGSVCRRKWDPRNDCDIRQRPSYSLDLERDQLVGLTEMDWLFFSQMNEIPSDKHIDNIQHIMDEVNDYLAQMSFEEGEEIQEYTELYRQLGIKAKYISALFRRLRADIRDYVTDDYK